MMSMKTPFSRKGAEAPTMSCSDRIIRASPTRMRPDLLPEVRLRRHRGPDAEDEQDRDQAGGLERERLNDERRADIGAEHDGERRRERDEPPLREGQTSNPVAEELWSAVATPSPAPQARRRPAVAAPIA